MNKKRQLCKWCLWLLLAFCLGVLPGCGGDSNDSFNLATDTVGTTPDEGAGQTDSGSDTTENSGEVTLPGDANSQPDLSQLSSLLISLASRPGVTNPVVVDILASSAEPAAIAFVDALDGSIDPTLFLEALAPTVQTYLNDYQNASSGPSGVEAKALALHQLYESLLVMTGQLGISFQDYEKALISAFASLEAELATPLLNGTISDFDHELVDLLLLHSVNDLNQRGYYHGIPSALILLGEDPAEAELLKFAPDNLLYLSTELEDRLADPAGFSDINSLIQTQFNEEAMRDLLLTKLGMEFFFHPSDFDQLMAQMDALGGVMTGMTIERFYQAGFVDTYPSYPDFSPPAEITYHMPWPEDAAYYWVRHDRPVSYQQDSTLTVELQRLGVNGPAPPDFSILSGPYLAMAQFLYDFDLCHNIAHAEWDQAEDESIALINQPLSMQKRLLVRQVDQVRRHQLLDQLVGATDEEKQAFDLLLTFPSR
jgi:hypothetical protein